MDDVLKTILNSDYRTKPIRISVDPVEVLLHELGHSKKHFMQTTIVHINGIERQARQCMEECAELIQALNKFLRIAYDGEAPHVDPLDVVTKELADAKNMIEQMIIFFENEKEVNEIVMQEVQKEFENACGMMPEKR